MKRKCRLLLTAFLLVATTAWGQEPDEAALDSLRQRDDFVTASLLVSTPGEKAYSAYGHCVVRMECPTFDLDYCFSFELYTDDTPGDYLRFFSGRTKAGFQAHKTSEYLQQCRHDGRGVTQWTLSLNPRQKQELWRGLDENIMEGMTQQFDYSYHNCTSMSFRAVGSQLQGERLVVKAWPEVMRQNVRDMYTDYSRTSQWMQLGMQTIMGTEVDDLPATYVARAAWLSPTVAFLLGLLVVLAVTLGQWRFGWQRTAHVCDGMLFGAQALAGVGLLYFVLVSCIFGLHWNWVLLLLNPLPLLLWLWGRRWRWAPRVWLAYAVVLLLFAVLLPYVTDQLLPAHRLLALALCVRCGSLSRKRA